MTDTTCACGCGQVTSTAPHTDSTRGWTKGQPVRFKHGHGGGRKSVPLADRFWDRVDQRDPDECWPWTGPRIGKMGYGRACEQKSTDSAHRVAYRLTYGEIPDGLFVRHACDNPPCCNPNHLLIGTPAENMRDMVERGRSACGERNASHVLTEVDVRFIRTNHAAYTVSELARRFGAQRSTVRKIRDGQTWKHIEVAS